MKKVMLAILFFSQFSFATHELSEPYRSIRVLPEDKHGWFLQANQRNLARFIEERQPKIVIELGTWLGASAIFMAKLLPEESLLYAIDDWRADTDIFIQKDDKVKNKLATLYQQFLSNVIIHDVSHKIVPMRMKTLEAAQSLNIQGDLIYVDASHDEESVYNDIMAWYPHLNNNGIMCGDDWSFTSVQRAVKRAALELNQHIFIDEFFWYFQPRVMLENK